MSRRYIGSWHLDGLGNGGSGFSSNVLSSDARPSFHSIDSRTGFAARSSFAAVTHVVNYDPSTIGNPSNQDLDIGADRFFVRVRRAPTSDQEIWSLDGAGFGSSGTDDLRLYLNSGRQLVLKNDGGAGGAAATRWTSAALDLNRRYCVEIRWKYNRISTQPIPNPPFDSNGKIQVQLDGVLQSVADGNGDGFGIDSSSGVVVGRASKIHQILNGGWLDITGWAIDDHNWDPDPPGEEPEPWIGSTWRTTLLEVAATGSHTGWTGGTPDWRARAPFNPAGGASLAATTSTNGASISYKMERPIDRGITGAMSAALICWYATSSNDASVFYMRNGSTVALTGALWTANNWRVMRVDASSWSPTDEIEIGATANASPPYGLAAVALIIEHDTPEPEPVDGVFRSLTGQYVGDGLIQTIDIAAVDPAVANQLPTLLFVVPVAPAVTRSPHWWFWSRFAESAVDTSICSFARVRPMPGKIHVIHDASNGMNTSGTTYRWIAVFDPKGRYLLPQAVSKDTTTPDPLVYPIRDMLGELAPTFTPSFIFGARATSGSADATAAAMYRGPGHAGDLTSTLATTAAPVADRIQSIDTGSFSLGTLIAGGTAFDYAFVLGRVLSGELGVTAQLMDAKSYVGDGTGPRVITLALDGEAPLLAIVVPHNTDQKIYRVTGDTTGRSWIAGGTVANAITAMSTANQVTVGSACNVTGVTYDVWAIAGGEIEEPEEPTFETPPPGTPGGGGPPGPGGGGDSIYGAAGLTWVEFTDKEGTLHKWSRVTLPDPAAYYGGKKDGRVIRFHAIKRALSDRRGQHEGASAGVVLADVDRTLRGILASVTNRFIRGRPVVERTIHDRDRRALLLARQIFRGVVSSYKALSPMHFEMLFEDILAKKFRTGDNEAQIPYRTITRDDFTDAPSNVLNTAVPIRYGDLSDGLSSENPPRLVADFAVGSFYDADNVIAQMAQRPFDPVEASQDRRGMWIMGWGPTGGPAPPTAIIMTELTGGSINLGETTDNRYFAAVTSVNGSGVEGDPHVFNVLVTTNLVIAANGARIQVSWTAPGTPPAAYRVYLGNDYYRWDGRQVIEVAHPTTSVIFDKHPRDGVQATPDTIATGAEMITFAESYFYKVSAVMSDGAETGLSAEAFAKSSPYRRPIRIDWEAVAGAASYRVYRRAPTGTWDRRWTVSAAATHFDDDLLDTSVTMITGAAGGAGAVPLIYVGTELAADGSRWHRYLVAAHAVKEIVDVFIDGERVDPQWFGVVACVPGKTGYSTFFPNTGNPQYREINGHRYTIIYGRGPVSDLVARGEKKATANIKGIESVGDGTGELITDLLEQYLHAVKNWIFGDYQAGDWLDAPTFPDDATLTQIDEDSFAAAATIAATRYPGGYPGAFSIDGLTSARDLLARFNVSADVDSGFNRKSQFFVTMFDESIDIRATAREYTQVRDIISGSFTTEDVDSEFFNYIPFACRRNMRGDGGEQWEFSDYAKDGESIENHGETTKSQTVEFWMIRNPLVAQDIARRRLTRSKDLPRRVVFETAMRGLSEELGNVIGITHADGIGAAGWSRSPVRITRLEYSPDEFKCRIEGWSVELLFADAFILGDETALDPSWLFASIADRVYGYLCDETTGTFSDGDRGKRLR